MSCKKCCVPGCMNSGKSHKTLHLFPNPAETERFKEWVLSIGGDILGLDNEYIFKQRRVCHAHFEDKYCCQNNRISNIAVPTINLPKPISLPVFTISERRPLRQIEYSSNPVSSTSSGCAAGFTTTFFETDFTEKENIEPMTNIQLQFHKENEVFLARKEMQLSKECHRPSLPVTQKIIKKTIAITHAEKKLYLKLVQIKNKLAKCRTKVKEQSASLKAAKNIINNPTFLNSLEKLSSTAKILLLMQFREHKKKGKGRRFTTEEKIHALSILKQSPKCYRFLRNIFILPAPRTLAKLLCQADVKPGINDKIFTQLADVSKKMKNEDKLCVLLFDEMALKANLKYSERLDKVIGFVTDGKFTKSDMADHAQVFMIRGLLNNYKKAVSYTFSAAASSGTEIATHLKTVVKKLQEAGFTVVATVCDQGTNNRQAIKLLLNETRGAFLRAGKEPKENVIMIENQEIIPLYDPPHLLKCIRNNLLTKDLQYVVNDKVQTAKWHHIELLHKENPGYKTIRLIPKLTDNHVLPTKIPKMKVKYASQIFSSTVASNMGYLAEKGILPRECEQTAEILLFFDKVFDSVNGSYNKEKKRYGKPLLGPARPNSEHHKMWNEAIAILNNMKFINKTSNNPEIVPTIKNWVWTLNGIQILLKKLETKYGITSVWMRHLNQDPIENFFGAIRSHGCRNVNPTPEQFQSAYTTLLINNMSSVHAPGANCEKDNCKALEYLIITDNCKAATTCDLEIIPDVEIIDVKEKNAPYIKGALDYVSGYFARCAKKNVFKNCSQCTTNIIALQEKEIIKFREYAGKRWLCSPTESLIVCVSAVQDITNSVLKKYLDRDNVKELTKTLILIHVDFDFLQCDIHKNKIIAYLLNLSCRFFIFNYVKNINKILSGKRDCDDSEDMFQMKAKKYFYKCKKRRFIQ